jgi:UDP-glucose 4-epimerase
MKILVTGGAGFIGSHVVDAYINAGHEVVVVDNLATGRRENLNPAARFYEVDICRPELEAVFATEQPQVVNHHAAQIDVRRSVSEPLYDAEVNILGSIRLLEYCRRYGVQQVIYSSTGGAVYGEPVYLPCDEAHPIRPICQYGASKFTVEQYLYLYHELYSFKFTVLRYANVFGPRQDPHGEAGVVAIFIGKMLAGEQPVINGDGEQTRDFIYVADCARANIAALDNEQSALTVNIGTGVAASITEVYSQLAALTGYLRPPVFGPAKEGETRHIYLTADQAQQALGWQPAFNLQSGLAETVAFFK